MALVPIDSLRRQVLRIADKCVLHGGVELLSYKRDRGITLVRQDEDDFLVIENGFEQQEVVVDRSGLPRILKTLFKREFPRSHKVRLLKFTTLDELQQNRRRI
jgi:hypothetical protein